MIRSMSRMGLILLLALTPLANPTAAAGAFDGSYGGTPREVRNNNGGMCQAMLQDKTPVVVANNVIKYTWVARIPLETTVSNDGLFSVDARGMASRGADVTISFKGQIKGGNLEAYVGGTECAVHLSYKKS